MHIPKPSEAEMAWFRSLVPEAPGVDVKAMFGNLGAFVNGNMFAGTFGPIVGVKLVTPVSCDELAAIPGAGPFGPTERPMGGYLALPGAWTAGQDEAAQWVERAMLEVAELPPKKPKSTGKSRRSAT